MPTMLDMLGLEGRLQNHSHVCIQRVEPLVIDTGTGEHAARPTDRWHVDLGELAGCAYGRTITEALDNAEGRSPKIERQTAIVMTDRQATLMLHGFALLKGFCSGKFAIQLLEDGEALHKLHEDWNAAEQSGELAALGKFMMILMHRLGWVTSE